MNALNLGHLIFLSQFHQRRFIQLTGRKYLFTTGTSRHINRRVQIVGSFHCLRFNRWLVLAKYFMMPLTLTHWHFLFIFFYLWYKLLFFTFFWFLDYMSNLLQGLDLVNFNYFFLPILFYRFDVHFRYPKPDIDNFGHFEKIRWTFFLSYDIVGSHRKIRLNF